MLVRAWHAGNDVPRVLIGYPCTGRSRSHRRDSHQDRRRFSGQTRGGYYYRARYYHPGLARFISEDPLGGIEVYIYSRNNPLGFGDPRGLFFEELGNYLIGYGWATNQQAVDLAASRFDLTGVTSVGYNPSFVSFEGQLAAALASTSGAITVGP